MVASLLKLNNSTLELIKTYQKLVDSTSDEVEYMDLFLGALTFAKLAEAQFKEDLLKDVSEEETKLILNQLNQEAQQISDQTVKNVNDEMIWN